MFYRYLQIFSPKIFWLKDFNSLALQRIQLEKTHTKLDSKQLVWRFPLSFHFPGTCGSVFTMFFQFQRRSNYSTYPILGNGPALWVEVLACPSRVHLSTLILSFLFDQQLPLVRFPRTRDIIVFSWSSRILHSYAVSFRRVDNPSVADDDPDSEELPT